jgi:hypothetical protein
MTGSSSGAQINLSAERAVPGRARAFDTVVLGGFTAGVLDILDALVLTVLSGGRPARMLQGIASGLLGARAFEGGMLIAALGLGLHFLIALGAATVYFLASTKLPVLVRRPVICGIAFGLCVWAFMQYVVLPLSLVRRSGATPPLPLLMNQLVIHALGVGLPIALFASRSAQRVESV